MALRAIVLALGLAGAAGVGSKVSLRGALRAGHRSQGGPSEAEAASRTLLTLDTNHDGHVDQNEVAQFAQSQGLDAQTAAQELSGLDRNGDGVLELSELAAALGNGAEEQAEAPEQPFPASTAQLAPIAPAMPQQPVMPKASYQPPLAPEMPQQPAMPVASYQPAALPQQSYTMLAEGASGHIVANAGASQVNAQVAAKSIVEQLALEERQEQEAQRLERLAAELRANSTSMARFAMQQAMDAGAKAATAKASELLGTLTRLEDAAKDAEVEAAILRAKSKAEVRQADELMSVANSVLSTDTVTRSSA